MSKQTVVIAVFLLLLLVPIAVAVSKPDKNKEPKTPKPPKTETVTFRESATLGAGNIYLGTQEIIDNILYVKNAVSTGRTNNGDSPISEFEVETSLSGTLNLNTYVGVYSGKWMITNQSGTFQGTITGNIEVATISGTFVGHGTNGFAGQKIEGTFEGSVNNYQVTITIQATITSKAE